MIMMGDKKKTLNQIMGDVPQDVEPMEEFEALSDEILMAIESKDPSALKDALKAFFSACDAEEHIEGKHEED